MLRVYLVSHEVCVVYIVPVVCVCVCHVKSQMKSFIIIITTLRSSLTHGPVMKTKKKDQCECVLSVCVCVFVCP